MTLSRRVSPGLLEPLQQPGVSSCALQGRAQPFLSPCCLGCSSHAGVRELREKVSSPCCLSPGEAPSWELLSILAAACRRAPGQSCPHCLSHRGDREGVQSALERLPGAFCSGSWRQAARIFSAAEPGVPGMGPVPSLLLGSAVGKVPFSSSSTQEGVLSEVSWLFSATAECW